MRKSVFSTYVGLFAKQMAGTGGKTSRAFYTTMQPFKIFEEMEVAWQLIPVDLTGEKEMTIDLREFVDISLVYRQTRL